VFTIPLVHHHLIDLFFSPFSLFSALRTKDILAKIPNGKEGRFSFRYFHSYDSDDINFIFIFLHLLYLSPVGAAIA
jgi:hypothetical protein